MSPIRARIKAGRVEVDQPVDWPDGTVVEITPLRPIEQAADGEPHADFVRRIAGSFGPEPFERPDQGRSEDRAAW